MTELLEITLEDPSDLLQVGSKLQGYVFRGQEDASWPLATAFERALSRYASLFSIPTNSEHWLLHEFRRQSHLHTTYHPDDSDSFEWMAMMQHYGCPTRLLDFSYSIYIAAYFALVGAGGDAAVWALNWYRLRDKIRDQFQLDYTFGAVLKDHIDKVHRELANSFIARSARGPSRLGCIYLEPKRLTDRIARQQGLFVMPTDANRAFMENLAAAYDLKTVQLEAFERVRVDTFLSEESDGCQEPAVIRLVIPAKLLRVFVLELTKMNITAATLFGGLEGLARSLTQVVIWEGP